MTPSPLLLILCNALGDDVRRQRGIASDSPAASRKVAMLAAVLRTVGIDAVILSLGRGRQDGSGRYYPERTGSIRGVPTIYGALVHRPLLSELLSMWAPVPSIWRNRRAHARVLLIYNRMPAYLPAIWLARLLGYRLVLDLEDGETMLRGLNLRAIRARLLVRLIDSACTDGALLACRALSTATHLHPQQPYYGVVADSADIPRFRKDRIDVLLGGTVAPSTGADLLLRALELLRAADAPWSRRLHLHVTGTGESLPRFAVLANNNTAGPAITVHGRLDDAAYEALGATIDVGLALKPNAGALADTTFPSKVVEMASAGILVLTTDISDVREVMGEGAIYLEQDDPVLLARRLEEIASDPARAACIATLGKRNVVAHCAPDRAAIRVRDFLFPEAR